MLKCVVNSRVRSRHLGMKVCAMFDFHAYLIESSIYGRPALPMHCFKFVRAIEYGPLQLVRFVSHFRPRDVTLGHIFFQMSSYARAHVYINFEKTRGKFP